MRKMTGVGIGVTVLCVAGAVNAEEVMHPLKSEDEKVVEIAMYTARGKMPELKSAMAAGLDAGLTVNEIKEVLVQLYAYCGFPRSLNALGTFMTLLNEREAKGIRDNAGKLPGPLPTGRSIEFGTANQTKLCGAPVKGALFEFAPAIDRYLKAHLSATSSAGTISTGGPGNLPPSPRSPQWTESKAS